MSKVLEMRQKRGELWDQAKAFLDEHQDANGNMAPEFVEQYEKMEQDIATMRDAIDRLERAEQVDRELNVNPANPMLSDKPERTPSPDGKKGLASDNYKNAFWNQMRGRNGLTVRDALQIGTDSEGGFLVPDEYERTLIKSLEESNKLRGMCTVIRTENGERKIPLVASHGTASWVDEEGAIPESDDAFSQINLGAHKLATMIKVSDELLQDSVFDVESYIANEFARRIGAAEETAFINGDGSAKPYGLLHATNGAGTAVTTAGTSFTADEVLDLVYSLRNVYRPRAAFLMNDSTIKALRKLKDGAGQYLWQPGMKEGEPDRLLNYRVVTSPYMPEIGAGTKPILYGDFSFYWIADRQGRVFQRLNELYAATGQIGFRATQRVDGRLILPEAMKCLKIKT